MHEKILCLWWHLLPSIKSYFVWEWKRRETRARGVINIQFFCVVSGTIKNGCVIKGERVKNIQQDWAEDACASRRVAWKKLSLSWPQLYWLSSIEIESVWREILSFKDSTKSNLPEMLLACLLKGPTIFMIDSKVSDFFCKSKKEKTTHTTWK